jgi:hypothetical protein
LGSFDSIGRVRRFRYLYCFRGVGLPFRTFLSGLIASPLRLARAPVLLLAIFAATLLCASPASALGGAETTIFPNRISGNTSTTFDVRVRNDSPVNAASGFLYVDGVASSSNYVIGPGSVGGADIIISVGPSLSVRTN